MAQSITFVVENYMNPKYVLQFIKLIFFANDHKILTFLLAAIIWVTLWNTHIFRNEQICKILEIDLSNGTL